MNFKEALMAHLNGETVEVVGTDNTARPLLNVVGNNSLSFCLDGSADLCYKFRIKPCTITVNGVEVPAPEKEALKNGTVYYVSAPHLREKYSATQWVSDDLDTYRLSEGVVYLNKEDAIARAKAMLIYKEV